MIWVIEYFGTPACWIAESKGQAKAFDVTFQSSLARRFTNVENASDEILRLGLSKLWFARALQEKK